MAIPKEITREHILKALRDIIAGKKSIPPGEQLTRYDLIYRGKAYPPKGLLRIAAKHAKVVLESHNKRFSGGLESNRFLEKRGFKIQEKEAWTERECYFAVYGYDQLDIDRQISKNNLYIYLADIIGRSTESVRLKILSVSRVDPRPHSEKPVRGTSNPQEPIGKVFHWYWKDREKARERFTELQGEAEFDKDSRLDITKPVGNKSYKTLIADEGEEWIRYAKTRWRSSALVRDGKKFYKGPDGKLQCHACGFTRPDSIKYEIVQLHHKKPMREGKRISTVDDLVPLCPNCHCMVHSKNPPMPVSELKELLKVR